MHVDIAFANISSSELLLIVELELVLFRNMPSVTYLVFFQKDHVICFYPFLYVITTIFPIILLLNYVVLSYLSF